MNFLTCGLLVHFNFIMRYRPIIMTIITNWLPSLRSARFHHHPTIQSSCCCCGCCWLGDGGSDTTATTNQPTNNYDSNNQNIIRANQSTTATATKHNIQQQPTTTTTTTTPCQTSLITFTARAPARAASIRAVLIIEPINNNIVPTNH